MSKNKHNKKSKIVQLNQNKEHVNHKKSDDLIDKYEDAVNNQKFLIFANFVIKLARHAISTFVFLMLTFVIMGMSTSLVIRFVDSSMSALSFLSEDLRMISTTSYATALMMFLLFKSNLYQNCYKVISKVMPELKDTRNEVENV